MIVSFWNGCPFGGHVSLEGVNRPHERSVDSPHYHKKSSSEVINRPLASICQLNILNQSGDITAECSLVCSLLDSSGRRGVESGSLPSKKESGFPGRSIRVLEPAVWEVSGSISIIIKPAFVQPLFPQSFAHFNPIKYPPKTVQKKSIKADWGLEEGWFLLWDVSRYLPSYLHVQGFRAVAGCIHLYGDLKSCWPQWGRR